MLSATQYNQMAQILSDPTATFEHSLERFRSAFKKPEYFAAGWAIQHLIQLNMLNTEQRLVGLYILYEIYLHENVRTTPFYQLVLNLLGKAETLHPAEKSLLVDFVKSVPKISKQTPATYVSEALKVPRPQVSLDLEPYRKAHKENMPKTDERSAASVLGVISDSEESPQQQIDKRKEMRPPPMDPEELLLYEYLPEILQPIPTSDDKYLVDNASWLTPNLCPEPLWDYKISESTVDYKELALQALKGPLSKPHESLLIEALKMSPEVAFEWEPSNIPALVEYLPTVALEALCIFAGHPKGLEYVQELFKMPLNAHQANLIVKLNERVGLHVPSFLEFIVNGIESCTRMNEKEKGEEYKKKMKHPGMLAGIISKIISKDGSFVAKIPPEVMKKVLMEMNKKIDKCILH